MQEFQFLSLLKYFPFPFTLLQNMYFSVPLYFKLNPNKLLKRETLENVDPWFHSGSVWLVTTFCCWSVEMRILKINDSTRPESSLDPTLILSKTPQGNLWLVNSYVYGVSAEIIKDRAVYSGLSLGNKMSISRALTMMLSCSVSSCLLLAFPRALIFIPKIQLNHNIGIKIINTPVSQRAPVPWRIDISPTSIPFGGWFPDAQASLIQGQGAVCWLCAWASLAFSS